MGGHPNAPIGRSRTQPVDDAVMLVEQSAENFRNSSLNADDFRGKRGWVQQTAFDHAGSARSREKGGCRMPATAYAAGEGHSVSPELVLVASAAEMASVRRMLPDPGTAFWRERPDHPRDARVRPAAQTVSAQERSAVTPLALTHLLLRGVARAAAVLASDAVVVTLLTVVADLRQPAPSSVPAVAPNESAGVHAAARRSPPPAPRAVALAWPAVRRARFYDLQIFRGTVKVLELWPSRAKVA